MSLCLNLALCLMTDGLSYYLLTTGSTTWLLLVALVDMLLWLRILRILDKRYTTPWPNSDADGDTRR